MSFGNRSSYATLKDAYGLTTFESIIQEDYNIPEPNISPIVIETFEEEKEDDLSCEKVKQHCLKCGCNKSSKDYINEILNLLLVGLLLWILIYKPSI